MLEVGYFEIEFEVNNNKAFFNAAAFGYGKKFGKVGGFKKVFASGHNKAYGKIVTFGKGR